MSKKAEVEIQFNWIYIFIIGGLVILLMVNVTRSIVRSSEEKTSYSAINYVSETLGYMHKSKGAEHNYRLLGLTLEFNSEPGSCHLFTIQETDFEGESTEFIPVFSSDSLGTEILSYSAEFRLPWETNTFLYLSSPEIIYVFVVDDPYISELFDSIPSNIRREAVFDSAEYKNQNYAEIRFISKEPLAELDKSVQKISDRRVSSIRIDPVLNIARYHQKEGGS